MCFQTLYKLNGTHTLDDISIKVYGFTDGQENCRFYVLHEGSLPCSLFKHTSELKCKISHLQLKNLYQLFSMKEETLTL
jgi:hypothetical protein